MVLSDSATSEAEISPRSRRGEKDHQKKADNGCLTVVPRRIQYCTLYVVPLELDESMTMHKKNSSRVAEATLPDVAHGLSDRAR